MSSSRRQCSNNPDHFVTSVINTQHKFKEKPSQICQPGLFGIFQSKIWAPNKVCKTCVEVLRLWKNERLIKVWSAFGVARAQNHHNDCYFCIVNLTGFNRYKKESGNILIWHQPGIPVPVFYLHHCHSFRDQKVKKQT